MTLSNVLITGESNFDEKNVEEMFTKCSTAQSFIRTEMTTYRIGTLVGVLYLRIFFRLALGVDERPFVRRRHIHELLAIHGSCKIVNGSDHIERLGQNLQLFWFCTFSYFPLDGCKHYRP